MTPGLLSRLRLISRPTRDRQRRGPRGSRIRSSRSAVLFGVLFSLAATLGLSAALETGMPEWRDPEYGHRIARLRQLQRASPGRPLVLALGTSRTQNAIDPGAMGFADEPGSPLLFNFGQTGSPPLKALLTLERVLDAGVRPSAVVLEVLPVWLAADGPAERIFHDVAPRLSAGDLARLAPYSSDRAALDRKWVGARIAPWSSHRVVLMSHWAPRWLPWTERIDPQWEGMEANGFVPFPDQFASPGFRAIATDHARREHAGCFLGYAFGESSLRAIRDLVTRCRREGIAVLFVEPPVSSMFRGWFAPGVWKSGDEHLRLLAVELGVELVHPLEGLREDDFIDGHHMLRKSAAKYSRRLAKERLEPWLARVGALSQ